ncbi:MAG: hypothetical protein H6741_23720 [Alphaproteobacteria bacterium]|nr:hypothetical protein [Alphaproteobacteria bacterium]
MSALSRLAARALPELQRVLGLGFEPWSQPAAPADSAFGLRPALTPAPGARPGSRDEAQHAWVSRMARDNPDAACERLGGWLVRDVPGVGPDWAHPSDAGLRLLHWALLAAWLGEGVDPDLRRRMAGSACAHAACLSAELGAGPRDHRRVLAAAGVTVAGLVFPDLPEARRWWSQGLSALGRALPEQLHADGSPRLGAPAHLALCVSAAGLALRFAEAAGVAPPEALRPALTRAALFLKATTGPEGLAPIGGPAPSPLPVDLSALIEVSEDLTPERGWRMLSFRDGGWVVAHGRVRGGASLVLAHAGAAPPPWGHPDAGQILWSLDDGAVLADPGWLEGREDLGRAGAHGGLIAAGAAPSALSLSVARVDGRRATLAMQGPLGPLAWTRSARVEGARVLIQDDLIGEGQVEAVARYPLGLGWRPEPAERGGWEARRGDRVLSVRADEGPLRWSWEDAELVVDGRVQAGRALVGRGALSGGDRLRVRFEIR